MKKTVLFMSICLVAFGMAYADSSTLMNYQGRLIGTNGLPVNAMVDVVINVYTQSVDGSPVYYENIGNLVVQDGLYSFNWKRGQFH